MAVTAPTALELVDADPAAYVPHRLHAPDRTYVETDCYTDILIELLHACGYEPLAVLGCTLRLDFEGDQWTFFKPDPTDLLDFYGIDVHEMQPYRPLPQQIAEQLARGRTMTVEVDSWYLPDTPGIAYRQDHVKTSIIPAAIDPEREWLRYFHNAGLFELSGEDFRGALLTCERPDGFLPPYAELVRFDAGEKLPQPALRLAAQERLVRHLAAAPATNPFVRFGESLVEELPRLVAGSTDDFHAYAFATVRIAGAGFGLAAEHVRWVLGEEGEAAAVELDRIVAGCKLLSFKLARQRPFECEPYVLELVEAWEAARSAAGSVV